MFYKCDAIQYLSIVICLLTIFNDIFKKSHVYVDGVFHVFSTSLRLRERL